MNVEVARRARRRLRRLAKPSESAFAMFAANGLPTDRTRARQGSVNSKTRKDIRDSNFGEGGARNGWPSGIGRAWVIAFARERASVMMTDIDEAGSRAVAEGIRAAGGAAEFVRCDVTNEEQVQVAVDAILQRFGSLDFPHNNAGNIFGVPPIFSAVKRQGLGQDPESVPQGHGARDARSASRDDRLDGGYSVF